MGQPSVCSSRLTVKNSRPSRQILPATFRRAFIGESRDTRKPAQTSHAPTGLKLHSLMCHRPVEGRRRGARRPSIGRRRVVLRRGRLLAMSLRREQSTLWMHTRRPASQRGKPETLIRIISSGACTQRSLEQAGRGVRALDVHGMLPGRSAPRWASAPRPMVCLRSDRYILPTPQPITPRAVAGLAFLQASPVPALYAGR